MPASTVSSPIPNSLLVPQTQDAILAPELTSMREDYLFAFSFIFALSPALLPPVFGGEELTIGPLAPAIALHPTQKAQSCDLFSFWLPSLRHFGFFPLVTWGRKLRHHYLFESLASHPFYLLLELR